jgi:hypothetical protein
MSVGGVYTEIMSPCQADDAAASRPPRYKYPRLSMHGIPDGNLASACDEAGSHPGMSPRGPRSTRSLHTPCDSAQQLIEPGQADLCDAPAGRRFAAAMPKAAMPTRGRRAMLHLEARSTLDSPPSRSASWLNTKAPSTSPAFRVSQSRRPSHSLPEPWLPSATVAIVASPSSASTRQDTLP